MIEVHWTVLVLTAIGGYAFGYGQANVRYRKKMETMERWLSRMERKAEDMGLVGGSDRT